MIIFLRNILLTVCLFILHDFTHAQVINSQYLTDTNELIITPYISVLQSLTNIPIDSVTRNSFQKNLRDLQMHQSSFMAMTPIIIGLKF